MDGWKRSRMLASVKWPALSWNPPTIRKLVGRMRKNSAKRKNGRTPRTSQETRPGRAAAPTRGAISAEAVWLSGPPSGEVPRSNRVAGDSAGPSDGDSRKETGPPSLLREKGGPGDDHGRVSRLRHARRRDRARSCNPT